MYWKIFVLMQLQSHMTPSKAATAKMPQAKIYEIQSTKFGEKFGFYNTILHFFLGANWNILKTLGKYILLESYYTLFYKLQSHENTDMVRSVPHKDELR